jgi:1-acyl-sn-glycerol-3-phosphate acyltransferase
MATGDGASRAGSVPPSPCPPPTASSAASARFAATLFYRLERADASEGAPAGALRTAPVAGPLLVVANHPNSLLDPALVTVAVGRPARFLAKAPLFDDPKVGWLVRASGAIPVHRAQDAAAEGAAGEDRRAANADTFRAAETALAAGDAIALFPEGISHARPALQPLKTGAARLALGAAARLGRAFPVVPVGITLDDRAIFRSPGLLATGAPLAWDDLAAAAIAEAAAGREPARPDLVHALTARIGAALGTVTASYASWEDARLVALAEAVHAAVDGGDAERATARLARRRLGADLLARARAAEGTDGEAARAALDALARDLRAHARLLGALRLAPADLAVRTDLGHRARVDAAPRAPAAARRPRRGGDARRLGAVPAHRARGGRLPRCGGVGRARHGEGAGGRGAVRGVDARPGAGRGARAALVGGAARARRRAAAPRLALVTGEGWRAAWRDARRFLVLRGRPARIAELRARQAALAERVGRLAERLQALPVPSGEPPGAPSAAYHRAVPAPAR